MNESQKLIVFLAEQYEVINEIGQSYSAKKLNEIGIIKRTYLALIEKVGRNIHGIINLLESDHDLLEHNRQPIMLLVRGIIEDIWLGAYLLRLKDDEKSFRNELNIIDLEFAKASEFLITKEPYFAFAAKEFQNLSEEQIQKTIKEKLTVFREKHSELYETKDGKLTFKNANQLRETSDPSHLILKNAAGIQDWNNKKYNVRLLYDIIEYVGMGNNQWLQLYSYVYLLYRVLSQYQHFSFNVTVEILNSEKEYEKSVIAKSVGLIYLLLDKQLMVLEIKEEQINRLSNAFQAYSS